MSALIIVNHDADDLTFSANLSLTEYEFHSLITRRVNKQLQKRRSINIRRFQKSDCPQMILDKVLKVQILDDRHL